MKDIDFGRWRVNGTRLCVVAGPVYTASGTELVPNGFWGVVRSLCDDYGSPLADGSALEGVLYRTEGDAEKAARQIVFAGRRTRDPDDNYWLKRILDRDW